MKSSVVSCSFLEHWNWPKLTKIDQGWSKFTMIDRDCNLWRLTNICKAFIIKFLSCLIEANKHKIDKKYYFSFSHLHPSKNFPDTFPCKVHNLHCTDNGEPSEETHGASNCWQHVNKLCCLILCNSVKCWGIEINSHKSKCIFPFITCILCWFWLRYW